MDQKYRDHQRQSLAEMNLGASHWLHQIRLSLKTVEEAKLAALLGDPGASKLFPRYKQLPRKRSRRGQRKKARAKIRKAESLKTWIEALCGFDSDTEARLSLALGHCALRYFDKVKRAKRQARRLLSLAEQRFLDPNSVTSAQHYEADNDFYWALRGHRWSRSQLTPVNNQYRRALQLCASSRSVGARRCFSLIWLAMEEEMISEHGMKNGLCIQARRLLEARVREQVQSELRPWVCGGDPLRERATS